MSNILREVFLEYATASVDRVIVEMRKRYTPVEKRGFILNGITYKISLPEIKEDSFEVDLISDIPKDELISGASPASFFKRVRKELSELNFSVEYIKSDISARDSKTKKGLIIIRDCIMMKSLYKPANLYSEEDILKEARDIMSGDVKKEGINSIHEANTVMGKLILYYIGENLYKKIKENIQLLINANEVVSKSLALKNAKGS